MLEDLRLLDFKGYQKATVIKKSWNWHKDRQIDWWNSIESRIDPYVHQLIFDQVNSIGKRKSLQQIVLEQLDIHTGKTELQPLPHLIPIKKKKNSKLILDLNLKAKTTKLLEENMDYNCDFGLGKNFLGHKKHQP